MLNNIYRVGFVVAVVLFVLSAVSWITIDSDVFNMLSPYGLNVAVVWMCLIYVALITKRFMAAPASRRLDVILIGLAIVTALVFFPVWWHVGSWVSLVFVPSLALAGLSISTLMSLNYFRVRSGRREGFTLLLSGLAVAAAATSVAVGWIQNTRVNLVIFPISVLAGIATWRLVHLQQRTA